MNSFKFYIFFSIFNILLISLIIFCMNTSIDLTFDLQGSPGSNVRFFYGAIIYIAYVSLKLVLPKVFLKVAKKYDNSIISYFVNYLVYNPNIKKKILLFAFCYDLPFLIYAISLYLDDPFIGAIICTITLYTISYVGGISLFYLMLYKEIEKNKI